MHLKTKIIAIMLTFCMVFNIIPPVLASGMSFSDDFSSDSLEGWTDTTMVNGTRWVADGKYNFNTASDYTNWVAGSDESENYEVSCKVLIATGDTDARVGILGYYPAPGSGASGVYSMGYDLYLTVVGGEIVVRLRDDSLNSSGNRTFVTLNGQSDARYEFDTEYTLSMVFYEGKAWFLVDGNVIHVAENLIYRPAGGRAGLRAYNTTGYIDDYGVTETSGLPEASITGITLLGVPEGGLACGYGDNPNLGGIQVLVNYDYQPDDYVPLAMGMIEGFDNTVPGTQDVMVNYLGETASIKITVIDRRAELEQLAEDIAGIDIETLTAADNQAVYALKRRYGDFTPNELKSLPGFSVMRRHLLDSLGKIEILLYPQLAGFDPVHEDDFTLNDDKYVYRYDMEAYSNPWTYREGAFYSEESDDGLKENNTAAVDVPMSEIAGISGDIKLTNENVYAGFYIGLSSTNSYLVRFTNKNQSNHQAYSVIINKDTCKNNFKQSLLCAQSEPVTEIDGLELTAEDLMDQWHNLRVIADRSTSNLYVYFDDVLILTYTDTDVLGIPNYGYVALRVTGDAWFDNVIVRGTLAEPQEAGEPNYYDDDFEDEAAGENPSHWLEESGEDNWKVTELDGNRVYSTTSEAATATWLYGFDNTPVFSASLKPASLASGSRFGLLSRYIPDGAYIKSGYDTSLSKWYIESCKGVDYPVQTFYSDMAELIQDQWYELKVQDQGHSSKLYVNDVPVVDATDCIDNDGYGRCGLFSDGTGLIADDISWEISEGTVTDGVLEMTVDEETYITRGEIEQVGDTLILSGWADQQYVSENEGESWSRSDLYHALDLSGSYGAVTKLHDGSYVKVGNDFVAFSSEDMISWTQLGQVVANEQMYTATGKLRPIIHVNGIIEVGLPEGGYRILLPVGFRNFVDDNTSIMGSGDTVVYYSDDGGVTWHAATPRTSELTDKYDLSTDMAITMEGKIVTCNDGSLRLYFSKNNYEGCISYTESTDYGETWSGLYNTEMQTPASSFNVQEDSNHPGTWYMVWVNDAPRTRMSISPRTRLSLARSIDGKNWEFVMDVDRMISTGGIMNVSHGHQIYQILDPSLFISDDYIYVTYGRSTKSSAEAHNAQRLRLVRINKPVN